MRQVRFGGGFASGFGYGYSRLRTAGAALLRHHLAKEAGGHQTLLPPLYMAFCFLALLFMIN